MELGILLWVLIFLCFVPWVLLVGRSRKRDRTSLSALPIFRVGGRSYGQHREADKLVKMPTATADSVIERLCLQALKRSGLQVLVARSACRLREWQIISICLSLGVAVGSAIALFGGRWWLVLPGGVSAASLPIAALRVLAARRVRAMEAVLPEVADILARALQAGQSLSIAISIVAEQAPEPARTEFVELFQQQRFGVSLQEAFRGLVERVPSRELRMLTAGILIQRDTGGNLVQVLERLAAMLRERFRVEGEVRAQTAQGRLTGWILCLLPVLLLILMQLLNPTYLRAFLNEQFGRACVGVSAVLLICGALIIRNMIGKIEV